MNTNNSDNNNYRTQQVRVRLSTEERNALEAGARKRHRSLSDYIRWLFVVDSETGYRLTDAGRAAIEELEKK